MAHSNGNIGPRKPRFLIFRQDAKTTLGSGFLFIFVFATLDLVENANNLQKIVPTCF